MNRSLFRALTWILWLAVPAIALRFWGAWDQLPARMATHFNAAGHPNGWMSREAAFLFAVGITAFVLVVFTAILWLMQKQEKAQTVSWAMLVFSYFVVGFVYYGNESVVAYNLTGQPINLFWAIVLIPIAVVIFMTFYLGSTRGRTLPSGTSLVEEVHSSTFWGTLLMIAGTGTLIGGLQVPVPAVRIGAGLIFLMLLVCGLAAWSGFRYSFTQSGLDITALNYRLRSIPKDQIKSYTIEPWNVLRGYGIRGVGDLRAYVWGNRGVMIDTTQGKVFLGHNRPEQIVRDLEMIAPRGAPVGPL